MPKQDRNKGEKSAEADGIIPFWNPAFFGEEDEDAAEIPTVDLPVLIDQAKGEVRSNTTRYKIPAIEYFEDNLETVLSALDLIEDKIMEKVKTDVHHEDLKTRLGYLKTVCTKASSSQSLNKCLKEARAKTLWYHHEDRVSSTEGGLSDQMVAKYIKSETDFFTFLERGDSLITEGFLTEVKMTSRSAYRTYIWVIFERAFKNHFNAMIFGSRAHEAYTVQSQYLQFQVLKPYGIRAVNCYRRIDMLVGYLKYFPASTSRNKFPNHTQWSDQENRKLSKATIRSMKKMLLPKLLQTKLNEYEEDWRTMTEQTFLTQVERLEIADEEQQKEMAAAREKLKKKNQALREDEAHGKGASRANRDKKSGKRRKSQHTTSQGKQRYCDLCKIAGAPEDVYTTHNTSQCRKADMYKKKLSGGFSSRSGAVKDYKREARKQEKRASKYKKLAREFRASRKSSSSRSSSKSGSTAYSSDSSVSSSGTDTDH